MPKRESSLTIKLTEREAAQIRQIAASLDTDVSELVRQCLTLGLPILQSVPFIRRIRMEDNEIFAGKQ